MSLYSLFCLQPEKLSEFEKYYGFNEPHKCSCQIRVNRQKKVISKTYKGNDTIKPVQHILRDICITVFEHPNIPKVYGLYFSNVDKEISASFQYLDKINDMDNAEPYHLLTSKAIYNLFKTIQYIHREGVHNCDICIVNIIFLKNGDIYVIDFDKCDQDGICHGDGTFVCKINKEYSDQFALLMFSVIYRDQVSCPEELRKEIKKFVDTILVDRDLERNFQGNRKYLDISGAIMQKVTTDKDSRSILWDFIDAFVNSFEKQPENQNLIFEYNQRCMNMNFITEALMKNIFISSFVDFAFKKSKVGDPDGIAFLGEVFLTGVESNNNEYAKIHYTCDSTHIKQRIRTSYLLFIKAMKNGSYFARDRISVGLQIMKSLLSLDSLADNQKILLAQMCEAFGLHLCNLWGNQSQWSDYFYEYDNTSIDTNNDLQKMLENAEPELIYDLQFKKLCTIKAKEIYEKNNFDFLLLMMKIRTLLLINPTNPEIERMFNVYKNEKIYSENFIFEMSSYYWLYKPDEYKNFDGLFNEQMLLLKRVPEPKQLMNYPVILQADVFEHFLADYFQLI